MKKILTILACLSSMISFVSCQKELNDLNVGNEKTRVITLKVDDNAECKSAFDGVDKISLTGKEHFNIFYVKKSTGITKGNVEAIPQGSKTYTFTIPEEINIGDYSWFAVSPYSEALQAKGTEKDLHAILKLSPVQLPGANTFDANYDYLISTGLSINEGSATIDKFKRLSAPLLLNVSGLETGEKIYAVTLSLSDVNEKQCLTGAMNVKFSSTFANAKVTSMNNGGNGVSAIYANGLAAVSGTWPVWFMVNPHALMEGSRMTVKVTTATKTYINTVAFPSCADLVANGISRINFNVKRNGYIEKNTIFQAFTESSVAAKIAKSKDPSLTASNGSAYSWNFSKAGCAMKESDVKAGMPYGMQLSAASGTAKHLSLPGFGKKVLTVKLFMHPANFTGVKGNYCISAKDQTVLKTLPFSNAALCQEGGVSSFELPTSLTTLAGTYIIPTGTVNIAAALFEVSDVDYDANDYYDMFTKGVSFTVGGKVINKTNYSKYELVDESNVSKEKFYASASTVLFIDNSKVFSFSNEGNIEFSNGKVVVGRYRNRPQPVIIQSKTGSYYFRPATETYLKNIRMESAGSAHFVTAGNYVTDNTVSFVCEDCTIICAGALLRESLQGKAFKDVVFNNCIIENAGTNGLITFAGKTDFGTENSITLNNCTVATKATGKDTMNPVASDLFTLTGTSQISAVSKKVRIYLNCNTFVGFGGATGGAALINASTIGGFEIQKNVFMGNWPEDKTNRVIKTAADQDFKPSPRTVSFNYAPKYKTTQISETNSLSQMHWNPENHSVTLSITKDANLWDVTDSPFAEADYLDLYFPINREVVTNGAGASYETKLWLTELSAEEEGSHEGFHVTQ